jgi:hypothetical protein
VQRVEAFQLPLEVGRVLEVLVDTGEAHVGDGVQVAQGVQQLDADLLALDLALPAAPHGLFDVTGDLYDVGPGDRPVLAGLLEAGDQLAQVELLLGAVPLEHQQRRLLDPLEGREAPAAARAGAAAPDRRPVLGGTGVDHAVAVVVGTAERAAHGILPQAVAWRRPQHIVVQSSTGGKLSTTSCVRNA